MLDGKHFSQALKDMNQSYVYSYILVIVDNPDTIFMEQALSNVTRSLFLGVKCLS